MARGATAKLRRRNRKMEDAAAEDRIFGGTEELKDDDGNAHDFGLTDLPLPPGMAQKKEATNGDDDDSDDEEEEEELVVIKKKKKKTGKPCCDADDDDVRVPRKPKEQGIKSTPLILLILMVGTSLIPGILYASDFIGGYLQKNHVLGQIGFRLGMGAVPRKRVLSFYEKHDPNKLEEVPTILSKYYGDYPKLVKKLERKYHDYGYFLGWEEDEAPLTLALEQVQETYSTWINSYWNVYAPQSLKTAARNIRYNLTFLRKNLRKVWKKHIYPLLEPIIGAPGNAEKQKRKDAAEARKRKQTRSGGSGTKRRSSEFRDDVEED